jgi:hypothetical protein
MFMTILLNSGLSCYGFKLVADVTSDESHSLEPRVGPSRLGPRSVACRNVPHQIQSLPTRSIYVVVGLLSSHPDIPLVNHLNQNVVQRAGDFPPRIMLPEFTHVGDIADVVTPAILICIFGIEPRAAEFLDSICNLTDRTTVLPTATEIVNLARPRLFKEAVQRGQHVMRVQMA